MSPAAARALANLPISVATLRKAEPAGRVLLLPPDDVRSSRAQRRSALRHLTSDLRSGAYQPSAALQVPVPKRSGGSRMAAVLTPDDRIVYEALTASLAPCIERVLCGPEVLFGPRGYSRAQSWLSFERAVLRTSPRWVVVADVADYFAEVRHDTVTEPLRRHGPGPQIDVLSALLGTLMESDRGLPQGLGASLSLSSTALTSVDRGLISQGWNVVRMNDDFRIAAGDRAAADGALGALNRELAAIGLRLRTTKTRVIAVEEYRRRLRSGSRWEAWMWDNLAPLVERRAHGTWIEKLGAAVLHRARATPRRATAASVRLAAAAAGTDADCHGQVVADALALLGTARPRAVFGCALQLLERWPAETPMLAACLRRASSADDLHVVMDIVETAVDHGSTLAASQRAWLYWSLRPAARQLPAALVTRVLTAASDDEWVVRVQAAWLLAHRGELGGDLGRLLRATAPAPLRASLPPSPGASRQSSTAPRGATPAE